MKKFQVLSIMGVLSTMSLVGCGGKPGGGGTPVDPTKAQLTVVTLDRGVGVSWLQNAARAFEELNKDREDFEEGKKGVQVTVIPSQVSGKEYVNTDLSSDVYFTESVDYYTLTYQGKLLDITDILESANAYEPTKRIIDKLDSNAEKFLNRKDGSGNNHYYGLPFYDCLYGFIYDKGLFDERGFYMTDAGGFTKIKSQFGTGPNGVAGDWDDGLPKTYDHFESLMNYMVSRNVTPYTYASATAYPSRALVSYWSDDEGVAETNLNYTFSGVSQDIVIGFDGSGNPITETTTISKENGYLLRQQKGVYNALSFTKDVLCKQGAGYFKKCTSNSDAQDTFVLSKYMGGSNKPVAMLFEGTWWENEARSSINEAKSYAENPDAEVRYGFMPIPKSSEEKFGDATYINLNNSYGFIAANSAHKKAAKEFFSYVHTDARLKEFTFDTNMTRGLNYSFTGADLNRVTDYAKDLIQIKQSEHVNIVYPLCGETFFTSHSDTFDPEHWAWETKSNGFDVFTKFMVSSEFTVQQYWNDRLLAVDAAKWANIIG